MSRRRGRRHKKPPEAHGHAEVSRCAFRDPQSQSARRDLVSDSSNRASGSLKDFRPQLDELGRLHRQWLSDLEAFKDSLRTQGAEPKVLEYVNEAFGRLAERIKQLAG